MSASRDAMSFVPPAARKQVQRANELVEAMRSGGQPQAAPPAAAPPAPNAAAPAAPPTPAAAAPPASMTIEQLNADWEHKYKVLQGKYNAEVPRLQRQLQENQQLLLDMRQQLTNTQTMLASLGSGQPAQNAAPPASPAQRRVKDEEIRAFGPDLFDFIKRTALDTVAPEIDRVSGSIQQRLTKTEATVDTAARTVGEEAVKRLYAHLNDQVPDWTELNEKPEFLAWLGEKDPYAGVPRGQLLTQAYQANDGPRVVAFFLGFKNENALVTPPAASAPAAASGQPEAQMLQLVAPGTPKAGSASGAPNDAGKRVWTRSDVQELYGKINVFTRKNKPVPADLKALEVDLIRAQSEGRIRA